MHLRSSAYTKIIIHIIFFFTLLRAYFVFSCIHHPIHVLDQCTKRNYHSFHHTWLFVFFRSSFLIFLTFFVDFAWIWFSGLNFLFCFVLIFALFFALPPLSRIPNIPQARKLLWVCFSVSIIYQQSRIISTLIKSISSSHNNHIAASPSGFLAHISQLTYSILNLVCIPIKYIDNSRHNSFHMFSSSQNCFTYV